MGLFYLAPILQLLEKDWVSNKTNLRVIRLELMRSTWKVEVITNLTILVYEIFSLSLPLDLDFYLLWHLMGRKMFIYFF